MERIKRTEPNFVEKRILAGAQGKRNSLTLKYEQLNREEKAFISSNNFIKRQLLSRQSKLHQLQAQLNKGAGHDSRPAVASRISFPCLVGNANKSGLFRCSSNLTSSSSRSVLRTPEKKPKRVESNSTVKDGSNYDFAKKSFSTMESNVIATTRRATAVGRNCSFGEKPAAVENDFDKRKQPPLSKEVVFQVKNNSPAKMRKSRSARTKSNEINSVENRGKEVSCRKLDSSDLMIEVFGQLINHQCCIL